MKRKVTGVWRMARMQTLLKHLAAKGHQMNALAIVPAGEETGDYWEALCARCLDALCVSVVEAPSGGLLVQALLPDRMRRGCVPQALACIQLLDAELIAEAVAGAITIEPPEAYCTGS